MFVDMTGHGVGGPVLCLFAGRTGPGKPLQQQQELNLGPPFLRQTL